MGTSVNGMVDVIEKVKQEDCGLLFSYTGAKILFNIPATSGKRRRWNWEGQVWDCDTGIYVAVISVPTPQRERQ